MCIHVKYKKISCNQNPRVGVVNPHVCGCGHSLGMWGEVGVQAGSGTSDVVWNAEI